MHRFLRWMAQMTCFCQRTVLLGSKRWMTSYGKICLKNYPKGAWICSFKPKLQNLHIAISPQLNPTNKGFEDRVQTMKGSSRVLCPKANTTWLTAAILKIHMTSYFCSENCDLDEIQHNLLLVCVLWTQRVKIFVNILAPSNSLGTCGVCVRYAWIRKVSK